MKLGKQLTRATIDTNTVNDKERTFEVVFASETPVYRRSYYDGDFFEILDCTTKSIRADRLNAGAVPLVDSHATYSIRSQYGTVVSWSVKNGECRATILFSSREESKGIWDDVKSGVLRSISVGYRVWKYEQTKKATPEQKAEYRAVDWEPMEISMVPVPADFKASVRAEDQQDFNEVEIITDNLKRTATMEGNETQTQQPGTNTPAQAPATETRAEQATPTPQAPVTATPQATAQAPTAVRTAEQILSDERARVAGINMAVRTANLEQSIADDLIARGVTMDQAREAVLNKMAELSQANGIRSNNAPVITGGEDEAEKRRNAMVDGLLHRAAPGSVELKDQAHDYKHLSMVDMAKRCLSINGERNVDHLSKTEVVQRAIATTDFPNLLTTAVTRSLRKYYNTVVPEWKPFGRQENAPDFRQKTGIKIDNNVTFEELAEGGEYKEAKFLQDDKAVMQLKTYARKISITRKAIINDDLSVFARLPQMIALGAQQFQAKKVWGLISGNAKTPDNKAIFHADHKNLASSGAVLSDDSLSAARTAMRRQKSPMGNELLIAPKFLIVPPELETKAQKLLTAIQATATGDVNIWAGRMQLVVVDYLSNTQEWYVAADPNAITADGLIYSYLEGEQGLFTETYTEKDTDNVVTKARLDFDATLWGWEGWYKNPGA